MMYRVLGNISCHLDAKVKGEILFLLAIASLPKLLDLLNFKLCRCISHMMYRVLGNILCNLDPKIKVKDRKVGTIDCS